MRMRNCVNDDVLLCFTDGSVSKEETMQETQEMWVQSLGQEDLLEGEMMAHSNTLA